MAALKLRVAGGCTSLFSVYAPHNLKPTPEKLAFYDGLEKALQETRGNGPAYMAGDFNARIGQRRPGEEEVLGEHGFGREAQHQVDSPNRDLLIEFCTNFEYVESNTHQQLPAYMQVTYHEPKAAPLSPIREETFAVLDLLLAPAPTHAQVLSMWSDRLAALASHHFPIIATLAFEISRPNGSSRKPQKS